jgi:hypothetical protein
MIPLTPLRKQGGGFIQTPEKLISLFPPRDIYVNEPQRTQRTQRV